MTDTRGTASSERNGSNQKVEQSSADTLYIIQKGKVEENLYRKSLINVKAAAIILVEALNNGVEFLSGIRSLSGNAIAVHVDAMIQKAADHSTFSEWGKLIASGRRLFSFFADCFASETEANVWASLRTAFELAITGFYDEISLGQRLILHGYLTASQPFEPGAGRTACEDASKEYFANNYFVWIRDNRKHDEDSDSEPPPLVTDSDAD